MSARAQTRQPTDAGIPRWRFYLVSLLLAVAVLLLLWRVASLQVVPDADRGFQFLQHQGDARTVRSEPIAAYRGVITDRNGEPLAVSTPVISLWADPQAVNPEQVGDIAQALGLKPGAVRQRLQRFADKEFVYLRRHLPPVQADRVLQRGFAGVYGEEEYQRYYPAGEVAAHLVGFTDIDDHGQEGLELAFEDWLSGVPGQRQVLKDRRGRVLQELRLQQAARPGSDLALAIDLRLQYLAYRELKAAVKRHGAKGGSLVVLDVASGEVLAMVNQPAYNPNNRGRLPKGALRNRALTDVFEPGSTVKPFTVVAALESGQYQPDSTIDTHPGHIRVGEKTLLDPVDYGVLDLTGVITKSSQVGTSKIALSLEPEAVRDVFFRLGLGQSTGVAFPGEGIGVLPSHRRWAPIERATFAFGHGLSLNTLQLAQAYAVIAADGRKRPLSLLRVNEPPAAETVIAPRIARQIQAMLRTVTQPGGTATRAQIPGYAVAGKTGTAHKVGASGYAEDRYIALFAGMAPAVQPRIVTVVMIDEPQGGKYFGGEVAAPVFAKVAAGALNLLHVPPSDVASNNASQGGPLS